MKSMSNADSQQVEERRLINKWLERIYGISVCSDWHEHWRSNAEPDKSSRDRKSTLSSCYDRGMQQQCQETLGGNMGSMAHCLDRRIRRKLIIGRKLWNWMGDSGFSVRRWFWRDCCAPSSLSSWSPWLLSMMVVVIVVSRWLWWW